MYLKKHNIQARVLKTLGYGIAVQSENTGKSVGVGDDEVEVEVKV
jgi:hypothetical protein